MNLLRGLVVACAAYIGLHLPRSYILMYILSALIVMLIAKTPAYQVPRTSSFGWNTVNWRPTILLCSAFSVSFVVGYIRWGLWGWSADRADIINALFLPSLLFWTGIQLGRVFRREFNTLVLLAYSLGCITFAVSALALSRMPWWDYGQIFSQQIFVPWGNSAPVNVRSVEQNGFPALLLLGPSIILLFNRPHRPLRYFAIALMACSFVGAHVIWSLDGRLGWIALVSSLLPCTISIASSLLPKFTISSIKRLTQSRRIFLYFLAAPAGFLSLLMLFALVSHGSANIWGQGLCDERFGMFAEMLRKMHEAPWGGRLLNVSYFSCVDQLPLTLAAEGGSIVSVHNVLLEIYYSAGIVPFSFLVLFLSAPAAHVIRSFVSQPFPWDWQRALRWSWLCLLTAQWLFQPLLYSDGILYYFTFLILGMFAQEPCISHSSCRILATESATDKWNS